MRGALVAASADIAQVARDPRFAEVDLGRALFVDTETTGLAGGTGTVPFLIGMAWFESESLHVQQLVLPELGREAPMLWLLAERLAAASCVVTYNGKSFDWPLLRNRYVLNRIPAPALPGHLDLLHCTRRVFRRRLERMRLVGIEQEILGFERDDDIDGALIPLCYFDFLRGVPGATLEPVLEHNHHDIVALAALLGAIGARCASESCDPREALSLAELLREGEPERARRFAEQAVNGSRSDALTVEALSLLARIDLGAGEHARAAERLSAALALATPECAPPLHLELAKIYEHRLRDPAAAREHAARSAGAEAAEAQARRLARLDRRLSR